MDWFTGRVKTTLPTRPPSAAGSPLRWTTHRCDWSRHFRRPQGVGRHSRVTIALVVGKAAGASVVPAVHAHGRVRDAVPASVRPTLKSDAAGLGDRAMAHRRRLWRDGTTERADGRSMHCPTLPTAIHTDWHQVHGKFLPVCAIAPSPLCEGAGAPKPGNVTRHIRCLAAKTRPSPTPVRDFAAAHIREERPTSAPARMDPPVKAASPASNPSRQSKSSINCPSSGLCCPISSRTAFRSLIPSRLPIWLSSAPRSPSRIASARRADKAETSCNPP